jgi:RHS repeat-associated protein
VVWLTVNAATNRISTFGFSYDAAGNLIQWPGGTVTISAEYDVEGRMSRVTWDGNVVEQHLYDARNRRVKSGGTLQLYGLGGELLGEYWPAPAGLGRPQMVRERIYFAGQLVGTVDGDGYWSLPNTDRLGSLKQGSRRYPFGDGNESYANDEYATYRKDTASAHYYAWHRYYSATWGRFSSPDPYVMSGGLTNPQGWNRYSYVANDPVNFHDPSGLVACGSSFSTTPGGWSMTVYDCVSWWSRLSHWIGGGGGGRESLGNPRDAG